MNKFYDYILAEVLNVSTIDNISKLFTIDKYFTKIISKYRKKIPDINNISLIFLKRYYTKEKNFALNLPSYKAIIKSGNLRALQFVLLPHNNCPNYAIAVLINRSISYYQLNILEWLLSIKKNNYIILEYYDSIKKYGTYELVQLLVKYDYIFDEYMVYIAAKHKDYTLLEKFRNEEMSITQNIMDLILDLGDLNIIEWINNNSYQYRDTNDSYRYGKSYKNIHYKLSDRNTIINIENMQSAIRTNNVSLIKWLLEHNYAKRYDMDSIDMRDACKEIVELLDKAFKKS